MSLGLLFLRVSVLYVTFLRTNIYFIFYITDVQCDCHVCINKRIY